MLVVCLRLFAWSLLVCLFVVSFFLACARRPVVCFFVRASESVRSVSLLVRGPSACTCQ